MPALKGQWLRIPSQLALFTGAALAILTGASFNVQGHGGETGLIVIVAGLLACGAGVLHRKWKVAAGLGAASLLLTFGEVFISGAKPLGINFTGLVALALGGVVGSVAYTNLTLEMRRRLRELERLNSELEEKHRIFLAATEDPSVREGDLAALTTNLARQAGVGFCCIFLASRDGREFTPQDGAFGFDKVHPQALGRRRETVLLQAIEAGNEFYSEDAQQLRPLLPYVPPGLNNFLAVPLRAADRVQGFVLLGNRPRGFSEDDRRLARTLGMRAAIRLASASDFASSQDETSRYAVLNEMMKQASTLRFDEAMLFLLERTRDLVAYDAARTAVFQPDGTYMIAGSRMSYPLAGSPLDTVRGEGRSVLRQAAARSDGLYSGIDPGTDGATAAEVLVPIRGKQAVLGALCFGRHAQQGFAEAEVPVLEEIGAIAGVAAEHARAVQQVVQDAQLKDRRLDDVRAVLETLAVSGQGTKALESKLLETACRLLDCSFGLISQRASGDSQRVTAAIGFPEGVAGMAIRTGQGVIGSTLQTRAPLAVADVNDGFELASPPDLAAAGISAALCVPMLSDGELVGTIAVFSQQRRDWAESEIRLLHTIATNALAALRNADTYESARRRIWELSKTGGEHRQAVVPVLHRIAAAVDARDPRTAGHSERVMQYAVVIAKELNYAQGDDAAWQRLRDGCLMLDIGKIAIPDAVLAKGEQLSPQEVQVIHGHTLYGYDMLNRLQMFTDELTIVRSHHERYDGSGYPDATRGEDLPLFAYIVGAADAIDAMVSERPHRASMSIEVALAEIEKGSGRQFHPDVATALLDSAVRGTLKVIRPPVALEGGATETVA